MPSRTSKTPKSKNNIFQPIVESIYHITGLPVSVWTPDPKRKALKITASVGLPKEYTKNVYLDLNKPSIGRDAFINKKVQKVMDINTEPRWKYKKQSKEMNWQSAICIPIVVDNIAVGVIDVYSHTKRSILDVAQILPDFAKQISLTLENAKQTEIRQRVLDIASKLQTASANSKAILNEVVKGACELTGANSAVIYPFDFENDEFYEATNVAAYGFKQPVITPEKPRTKGGMAALVIKKGEVIVEDISKHGSANYAKSTFIRKEGVRAFIGIALKETKNLLGVLYVNFNASHIFSRQEKETIRLFAHQAANALNNARLYQRLNERIDTLEKLHEAGTSLTSMPATPGDLKETLTRIAQSAKQVLGADLIELYQYDQSRDWYDLPPIQTGKHFDVFVIKDKIHEDDVIWEVVRGKQPVYTANAQESKVLTRPFTVKRDDSPKQRFVIRENIKSSAALPLLAGSEVVGVIFANYRIPQSFSKEQTRLIELFASQAAIAIRNARLFQQLYEYMQLLNIQIQALHAVAQKQKIEDVLEQVLIGINTIFGNKTSSSINLYDESKNYFYAYQAAGPLKDYLLQVPPRPLGKGGTISSFVIETKSPIYLDDVQQPPDGVPTIRQESINKGVCSFAALPLKRDKHVLGILFVNSQKPIDFTDNIKGILELFAGQAAVTIENARLYDRLNFLVRISQIITSTIDLDEVLDRVLKEIILALGAHFGTVQLVERTTGDLIIRAYQGKVVGKEYQRVERGKGITGQVALSGETILANDLRSAKTKKDSGYLEYFAETRSELAVPIKIEDRVIGVLNLEHTQPNAFNENDVELLETIANQIATAIRNSTLNESLVNLGEATVFGGRLQEYEIVNLIHSYAGRVMDTDNMYIAFYDADLNEPDDYDPQNPDKGFIHGVVRFGLVYVDGNPVDLEKDPSWQPRKAGKGRTEEIIRTRKPIFTASKEESEAWYKQPGHKEYVGRVSPSWLGVPMMVGDKVLGVIATYHPTRDFVYSEDDLIALQHMANQAAILFDSSRLFYKTNLRLNALVEFGQDIIAELYLGEGQILTQIHRHASDVVDTDNMYIALYDADPNEPDDYDPQNPDKGFIHGVVRFGLAYVDGKPVAIEKDPNWQPRKAGKGRTEEIIRTRKPIFTASKEESEAWYKQPGHKEYVGKAMASWLGVPMMVGDKVLGVIATYHPTRDFVYSPEDLTLLQAMASQAAVAIDSARIASNLYDANQQLGTVQRIINAVEIHTDLREFLQNILENLLASVDAQNGTIQLYDPKREELIVWAEVGYVNNNGYQHISLDIGLTGMAARERLPIYEPDIKETKEYAGYFENTKSEFAVPMLVGDMLIGVLNAEDPKRDAFNAFRRQLIERLGSQLAILIRQKIQAQEVEEKKLVNQVNESLGLVTAEVAHKVGNAAGKIRYITGERLLQAANITEEQKKDFQIILRNVEDMIDATEDLFKPFGTEPKAEISIQEMIRVAIGQCAIPTNIELLVNLEPNLPKVFVQVTKVQSYLAELLNNAIKYTLKGMKEKKTQAETIKIIGQQSNDGHVDVYFTNHGPAIPSNRRESIFRVFSSRSENSRDEQSYGLGLWGTRATIQQQGGDVFLLESDDVKTTFVVRLPYGLDVIDKNEAKNER